MTDLAIGLPTLILPEPVILRSEATKNPFLQGGIRDSSLPSVAQNDRFA
jgi:hypothetical protein